MVNVAPGIWEQTLVQFRQCGQGRRECVVFWLGPASQPASVDLLVHPVHYATRGYFELDQQWLADFWVELVDTARSIRVQVHTHEDLAFHSDIDDEGAIVHVPGFLSLVLPAFAGEDVDLDGAFLARLDDRGRFTQVPVTSALRFADGRP
jgi:hypothetical protein